MRTPSIVVITIDCGRHDHVLGGLARTPALDSLRREAVTLTCAYSQAASTIPALYSLFTGLYPHQHGHYSNLVYRPMGSGGLPRLLAQEGWLTAAFTGVYFLAETMAKIDFLTNDRIEPLPWVNERLALGPTRIGKPRWHSAPVRKLLQPTLYHLGLLKITRNARNTVDRAVRWLRRNADQPFLLWVHLFDAHMVYYAPRNWIRYYYPDDPRRGTETVSRQLDRRNLFYVRESYGDLFDEVYDLNYYPCRYRAALSYIDRQIGRLIAVLKENGLFDSSFIVVTSDHGENLGEHGIYCTHKKLFAETTRVPLVIKFPGGVWKGEEISRPVEHVDLVPTLLDVLGMDLPPGRLCGQSLLPLVDGRSNGKPFTISEHEDGLQFVIRTAGLEYYWSDPQVPNPYPFAFETDLLTGPQASETDPDPALLAEKDRLHQELTARVMPARRWYLRSPADPVDERLRSLGYL